MCTTTVSKAHTCHVCLENELRQLTNTFSSVNKILVLYLCVEPPKHIYRKLWLNHVDRQLDHTSVSMEGTLSDQELLRSD